jgi:SAM-dependent methyltransferase
MDSCPVCLTSQNIELFCVAAERDPVAAGVIRQEAGQGPPRRTWEIHRCRSCGLGWTFPPPQDEELEAYYPPAFLGDTSKTIESFLDGRLQRSRSWKNEVEKVTLVEQFVSEGSILDIGCGEGKFLWALDSKRWQKTGIEFVGEVVRMVKSRIPGLTIHEGDVFCPELREGSFDVITLWHVLEHLPEPGKVLPRLVQLLRPGGWLFISVPNFGSWQARIFRHQWYALDVPRHVYHFSHGSLCSLLTKADMNVRRCVFFSRRASFHQLKHSMLNLSQQTSGSRLPYYLTKPFLFVFSLLEGLSSKYGVLTIASQKPPQ